MARYRFPGSALSSISVSLPVLWKQMPEAERLARSKGKLVLVDVTTKWAGWSNLMEKNTYSKKSIIRYLNENFFDLHYAPLPQARPFSFGLGHLWRIATEHPGSPVPPCIHRAPATLPGQPPRLLLIS